MSQLGPYEGIQRHILPAALHQQVLVRCETPEPCLETRDEFLRTAEGGLPGNGLNEGEHVLRPVIYFLHQHLLALFCTADVFDVGAGAEPVDDLSGVVAQRDAPGLEPSIFSIETADAV